MEAYLRVRNTRHRRYIKWLNLPIFDLNEEEMEILLAALDHQVDY
jgi:hypothetical protein